MLLNGACICGAVTFTVDLTSPDTVTNSMFCHCSKCQTRHSAPFVHSVHLAGDAVKIAPDAPVLKINDDVGYDVHCAKCATNLGYRMFTDKKNEAGEPVETKMWAIYPETLAREGEELRRQIIGYERLKATDHIYYGTRRVDIVDGLPKWEGWKKASKKLSEVGHEVVE